MTTSLRDLGRHADSVPAPSLDIPGIIERGNARLHRRRTALALGVVTLVASVVAAAAVLAGSDPRSSEPVEQPSPSVTESPEPAPAVRPLTYADDYVDDFEPRTSPQWLIRSIHYGDHVLRPGVEAMHVDVTDDGLALVDEDGGVYFTDGSSVERIGELTFATTFGDAGVQTDTSGSLVAWFSAGPATSLVVYDGRERSVVARRSVPGCDVHTCRLQAVVGDRVYFADPTDGDVDEPEHPLRALDLASGRLLETDLAALWEDLRARPRAVIKGDSFTGGEVVRHEATFIARGSRLELRRLVRESGADGVYGYGGFDTTGRRLDLRLPDGYRATPVGYNLFQWLDDDRFAVMAGAVHNEYGWSGFPGYGDILVCDIAEGRCELAAEGPGGGRFRLVPHVDVPN